MKKIDENYEFARFLKANADDQELDEDFKRLHKKYFTNYDCSKCRKCCKKLYAKFQELSTKFEGFYTAVENYSRFLTQTVETYQAADQAIAGSASDLAS